MKTFFELRKVKTYIWYVIIFCLFFYLETNFIKVIATYYKSSLDNIFASRIVEHWYLVLQGKNSFYTNSKFYPIDNNVGTADMMAVFAPFVDCQVKLTHFYT